MSSLFFRVFQHLLPKGHAFGRVRSASATWTVGDDPTIGDDSLYVGGLTGGPTLWRFIQGLADGCFDGVRAFADAIFLDVFPDTTRQLAEWEKEFGIEPNPDEATRRLNLAAEWSATGGQSPGYIQGVLQTAGFDVYVYDWWSSGPPYVARTPGNYTVAPLVGSTQCVTEHAFDYSGCQGSNLDGSPSAGQLQCDGFLANETHYLVNLDLSLRPPPRIVTGITPPGGFMYIGGPTFPATPLPATGDWAEVPASRRGEFERLVLKLRPLHLWVVTLVKYV